MRPDRERPRAPGSGDHICSGKPVYYNILQYSLEILARARAEGQVIVMSRECVLAYDLGTSGVKAALVDLEGKLIGYAVSEYPLITPHAGWAEQDPENYWESVCKATKEAIEKCGQDPAGIKGLAISGQWKGIIPIDKDGKVMHNSIIWLDARAGDQAKRLNDHFGKEHFCAADYWPKVMWLRENEPEIYDRAVMILEANSFIKWKMTGEAAADYSNHFTKSFDPVIQDFYDDYLNFCNMDGSKFPRLVKSAELVGRMTKEASEALGGVPEGTPVFGGCNDIQAIAIGSGTSTPGGVHINMGSSGWVGFCRPHVFDDVYICPFDEKRDIYMYGLQSVGLSYKWTVNELFARDIEVLGGGVYDLIDENVAKIPAGSEGVFAMPWFYGERPPLFSAEARGCFLNMSGKTGRFHMTRAIMEGISCMLRMGAEYSRDNKNLPYPTKVSVVGGCTASDVWMQILADVMNVQVNVPYSPRHSGAIGTAYCALIGLGICRDFEDAANTIGIERSFTPDAETVKAYNDYFEVFRSIHGTLYPLFTKVNAE